MRNRIFLALDLVLCAAMVLLAFAARFEGVSWPPAVQATVVAYLAVVVPVKILLFFSVGLYRRLWRYASIADLEVILIAAFLGALASFAVGLGLPAAGVTSGRVPIGVMLMDSALTAAVISLPRLLLRVIARRSRSWRSRGRRGSPREPIDVRRVLIAGAGDAGGMIAKELLDNPQLGLVPIGFIDDDVTKHGHSLHGLPVLGNVSMLGQLVHRFIVAEVIIALPSARGKVIRDIVQASAEAGVRNRTVPGLYEILSGAKAVSALRPIQIEDLLRREPVETNLEDVGTLVRGRTVLITGAGGSIGSELCRQLARLTPESIIAVGRGENSIFELLEELRENFPHVVVRPAIVDVRDEVRLRAIFEQEQPYSVFHTAAHKHVPLMEASVDEAILNNVLGTRNVAELCAEYNVEHLVLISTDKAVRPTSIMGATKRIAEKIVGGVAQRTGKPYVSVRFGNVLGSRGSVVPTFMRQILAGGPITITHPEMRRYFMTIPEAVQLVLQAATLGRGGEVFVLDMGDPVKIADLAEDLIRLSGLEVGSDIEISYTGTRPGEKLYEELFFGPDDATPTSNAKILRARDGRSSMDLDNSIDGLIAAARRREPVLELRRMIHYLVPEYSHPSVNRPTETTAKEIDVIGPVEPLIPRRSPEIGRTL
jgi:FlaA1/EpsC-like NDP-sugar epimerase